MIISALNTLASDGQIQVDLYRAGSSTDPFILWLNDTNVVHMTAKDAKSLQLQLEAAIYEYETTYPYKESE